jgi:hypothetical protein
MKDIEIVDDNVTSRNIPAAVSQRWLVCFGEEANRAATGLDGIRVNLRQFGGNVASKGGSNRFGLDRRDISLLWSGKPLRQRPECQLITEWIIKTENSAPRHWCYPRRVEIALVELKKRRLP